MDFYRPAHALIFEAICALDSGGRPRDPVAVGDELRQRGALGRMGGAPYLITCMQACPAPASAGYYAGIVRDHARRRRLIEVAARLHQTAMAPGDPDTLAERVSEISVPWPRRESDTSDTSPGSIRGLLTGMRDGAWLGVQEFAPLRYHVPGIIAEGVTVLAGAPKVGKSWLVLGLRPGRRRAGRRARQALVRRVRPVFYLALEDGDRRMQERCRILLDEQVPAPGSRSPPRSPT